MWNGSIKLPIGSEGGGKDSNGFPIEPVYIFMDGIPASLTDVTRNDEMLASQKGYTADLIVEIMACNYSGQSFLVDESTGKEYDIVRTHQRDKKMTISLTCQYRERGKQV